MTDPTVSDARPSARADDQAALLVEESTRERVVGTVPGTSYRLELALAPGAAVPAVGKRARGIIEGRALRMHRAKAGGRFIEPADGHPRIVQGTVSAVDAMTNRVLLHAVVPMWLTVHEGQSATAFRPGDMVNCYVESGLAFR